MKQIFLIMMCLAMLISGCIGADYKKLVNPEVVEFKFRMVNEADIGDLEITAPGWHVKASRIYNRTAVDQGLIVDGVRAFAVP